ncbi:ThuA domain-containing protein [Pelagicoccus sp. NFK12]|uniref:ThuA domain-containing protein n=2 Tax=Pelagicoccus enzymogenes TaxID=2773457 RepID=A0A927F617_9BACT|nr:ThuA domain-containing protein [Pelagicoccus enzymogenes]
MTRTTPIIAFLLCLASSVMAADSIKVMHLTGQSNKYHSWKNLGDAITQHLENAGIFEVDTVVSPALGEDMSEFSPNFGEYDVIVLNYDGAEWSEPTKAAFVSYVKNGGGLVTIHGTNNSFAYWPEFNEIIGLGGWGGAGLYDPPLYPGEPDKQASRDEKWGPRVYWHACGAVHDDSPGGTFHPPKHDFIITNRTPDHPIMRGLPEMWLQANDEVYSRLRGPAKNLTILATAYANQKLRGSSPHNEPMLFTVAYGKGRVFQTTLGHVGANDDANVPSVRSVGFIVTLQRGVEWAATGEVTQALPEDFPTAYETSVR